MNRKIAIIISLAMFAAVTLISAEPQDFRFKTVRTPAEGIAKPGEKIVFTASILQKGKAATVPIKAFLHVEGLAPVAKEGSGEITMETTAPESGFTYFSATYTPEGEKKSTLQCYDAVASEPQKIRQGMPEPADFDLFWKKAKAEIAAVPVKTTIKQVAVTDDKYKDKVDCFEIRIDAPGKRRAFGYLCLPKDAAGKKLPALIRFDGAGVYKHSPPYDHASDGFLAMSLNAHGIDYGEDATEEQMIAVMKEGLYYSARDWDDLQKVPFYHMILRDLRGLEYLNGKHLV
ncbi:MAG: acetylxylan esterase [Victivallales bacterium]|jgi:hypothetical protein